MNDAYINDLVKLLRDPLEYLSPEIVSKGMKAADALEAQAERIAELKEENFFLKRVIERRGIILN